ncbi:MAG: hypothetical protein AB7L66_16045 [Gemmatimonadales bacterium]
MDSLVRRLGAAVILVAMPAPVLAQSNPSAPQVTIGGVIYGQYSYALRSGPTGHANNFDISRAYVNVNGKFAQGVGSRITGDVYRVSDGSLSYRLKYAFMTWKPEGSTLTYKFGLGQTPFIDYAEGLWDYRMQGTVAADRTGYLSSSDFGASVDGSWKNEGVSLSAGVYNGEFYSKTPGDKHKDLAGRISVRLAPSDDASRFGGLRLTGFALVGQPNGGGTRERYLGQLSYRTKAFTLGAELMSTRDRVDTTATVGPTTTGRVMSLFGVVRVPDSKVGLIARLDANDRNTSTDNDQINRLIAGVSYQLSPNVRWLVDIDNIWYQGGSPSPAADAARSQLLFQMQLVF